MLWHLRALAPEEAERVVIIGAVIAGSVLCALVFLLAKEVGRREALDAALRRNEERFRNFAEASSDWFWEQDETFRFTFFSKASGDRGDMPVPSYLGKTGEAVATGGLEAAEWRQHKADLEARRPFRDFRYKIVTSSGAERHISVSGRPVFDKDNRFRGYAGSARDVTAEIAAARRLYEAKAEAEAASRAKSEFLAVMSHELRTPLNAIIGFSDVITREVFGPVGSGKYREYANDILVAGRHLLGLITSILDMSKIEARKMELHDNVVDLASLLADCAKIVDGQAAAAGIHLLLTDTERLPSVRGDEIRLKQVVLNLLSNAIKFTAPGGRVTLAAAAANGGAAISVSDTGIGMDAAAQRLALEPFRQVEGAASRKYEGTGLGLPLARAFIELHGGTLDLQSAPGEGTTVTVTLPADRVLDGRTANT